MFAAANADNHAKNERRARQGLNTPRLSDPRGSTFQLSYLFLSNCNHLSNDVRSLPIFFTRNTSPSPPPPSPPPLPPPPLSFRHVLASVGA
ncbi:hypothetical protein CROQUDRAFT_90609 [Cronartium quercuum f. sp. fusiforme G11]|uniref:Uncharacterized protein n=1 Tax=Cronartium quercuum f. sp. fusiforme G11 TaxID=708437 RepID=A0A9P6NLL5_9BASI|nr:hypothetical protein CROQUDRAFT_90609 [Cronartium quercuum f. sp. fusiforme G11]